MTDTNGNFTLPVTPGYDYVIMTQGGTDTITGGPAMCMYAPAGAANVSPFTTLVHLNPNAKAAIEALGITYDADVSAAITPAALLLLQSAQSIVAAVSDALNPNGNSLSISTVNDIQMTIMNAIANELASIATGTVPAARFTDRYNDIEAKASGCSNDGAYDNRTKSQQYHDCQSWPGGASHRRSGRHDGCRCYHDVDRDPDFQHDHDSCRRHHHYEHCSQQYQFDSGFRGGNISTEVHVTPPADSTPVISGTPVTTAVVGVAYSFVPTVSDSDAGDVLTFRITNKPAWASFNQGTGAITGTPSIQDVGTTNGIVITVTDGIKSASLPAFSLTVSSPTGGTGGTQ